jgi:hypothetical protein
MFTVRCIPELMTVTVTTVSGTVMKYPTRGIPVKYLTHILVGSLPIPGIQFIGNTSTRQYRHAMQADAHEHFMRFEVKHHNGLPTVAEQNILS